MDGFKTLLEPYKIKVVEKINFTSEKYRRELLKKAKYNLFAIRAEDVTIDLLTDSGTSAMSDLQWSGIMQADEAYAGAKSFYKFEESVKTITGLKNIIPTHQGRAAEKIIFSVLGGSGKTFISNTHFDTTRANVEASGATALDLVIEEGKDPALIHPFKGNIDTVRLEKSIVELGAKNIPFVLITVTNNSGGGQPVSMQNLKDTKKICQKYNIPLFLDCCRFAENAYFIKTREKNYSTKTILEITKEMFSYADGAMMSAKKDALVNMGGFIALNDEELTLKCKNMLILTEGFPTYGGLSGRDLEAIAQGLKEVIDEEYLKHRVESIAYLGDKIRNIGIPIIQPVGGHAVYIDAKECLKHIPKSEFPAQAFACELYAVGGIRGVEIGSVMFGKNAQNELVRLTIPRRVYTISHFDYIVEALEKLYSNKEAIRGLKISYEAPQLRHFTAQFELL